MAQDGKRERTPAEVAFAEFDAAYAKVAALKVKAAHAEAAEQMAARDSRAAFDAVVLAVDEMCAARDRLRDLLAPKEAQDQSVVKVNPANFPNAHGGVPQ